MHIEILVEDSSSAKLLDNLLPKMVGANGDKIAWRIHNYKGIGKIPTNLRAGLDAGKRILLEQLPRLLRGLGKTPGIDAVVVLVDSDRRDREDFYKELIALSKQITPLPRTLFQLATEEIEAWYFGDRTALLSVYPRAKKIVLSNYVQDSVCGTWEMLADAVYPGGSAAILRAGWPASGNLKHEWAERIGSKLDPEINTSPSFCDFRDNLKAIIINDD